MQNAMEEMDPQKLLDALNDFEFDMDGFEEQLDRFIDMFELALAEQKMDEVIKKLENVLEEQTDIVSKLVRNFPSSLSLDFPFLTNTKSSAGFSKGNVFKHFCSSKTAIPNSVSITECITKYDINSSLKS